MSKVWIADLQILGSAFFFGIGFIGQRAVSVEGLGPMTCNALRFALSAFLLVAAVPFLPPKFFSGGEGGDSTDKEKDDDDNDHFPSSSSSSMADTGASSMWPKFLTQLSPMSSPASQKSVLHWGIYLGCINFMGSGLQQVGITFTAANKVAFIAGFDLFLTPIFALFIPTFKRNGKPTPSVWLAVSVSILGLYLLSNANFAELSLIGGRGEMICLVSTVFWTLHITYTDIATSYVDCLHMMCVQLSVVSLLSATAAILFEPQAWFWHHMLSFVPWMLFLAVVEGLGFTLMAMGQHFSPPTHAAILLSLEGVFASVASYLFLGETLSSRELSGCVLMLCATMIAKLGCCHLDFAVAEAEKTMYSTANGGSLSVGALANGSGGNNAGLLEAGVGGSGGVGVGGGSGGGGGGGIGAGGGAPISCAMRVKACVTIPAIMLRESIANFRVNVAYVLNASGWLVTNVKLVVQWLWSLVTSRRSGGGGVGGVGGSGVGSGVGGSSGNSSGGGMHPMGLASGMDGSSGQGGSFGKWFGLATQHREQHQPLISRDSLSNLKI